MTAPLYAQYDVISDPASVDLCAASFATVFGDMFYVHSAPRRPGRTLLLMHGVGGTWSSWTPVLAEARARGVDLGDIVAVDLPGFGRSPNGLPGLPADLVASELLRFLAAIGRNEFTVVGHSMGGFLALHLASLRPDGLNAVLSLSGAYVSVVRAVQHPVRTMWQSPSTALSFAAMRTLALADPLAPAVLGAARRIGLLPTLLRNTAAHPNRLPPAFLDGFATGIRPRSFLMAARNGKDYRPCQQWGKIAVPTWLTFGAADALVPATDGEELRRDGLDVTLATYADTGHFAPVEHPDLVLDTLVAMESSLR